MKLEGKTALVTGGAHRVGRAITLALAQAGANLVINYHASDQAAQGTAEDVRAFGVKALAVQADVSDLAQVQAMVAAAQQQFGMVDVLINAASRWEKTPFPTQDVSGWQRVTRILLDGSFYCANLLAPAMIERGEGTIVNIVDLAAFTPWASFTAHVVGKAGLLALTRQLALELAPTVRVNAVAPGPVLPPPGSMPNQIKAIAGRTLLERWGTADDVTQAVLFLIAADYITGEVIVVDGGERWGRWR